MILALLQSQGRGISASDSQGWSPSGKKTSAAQSEIYRPLSLHWQGHHCSHPCSPNSLCTEKQWVSEYSNRCMSSVPAHHSFLPGKLPDGPQHPAISCILSKAHNTVSVLMPDSHRVITTIQRSLQLLQQFCLDVEHTFSPYFLSINIPHVHSLSFQRWAKLIFVFYVPVLCIAFIFESWILVWVKPE